MNIWAPKSFWFAADDERADHTNGCGPKGLGVVPGTVYGLNIAIACDIHDWQYMEGFEWGHKDDADRVFLANMLRLISISGGARWIQWLRRRRAWVYYRAVSRFGGPAFWVGK